MRQFISSAIRAFISDEFDEGRGQYFVYKTPFDFSAHYMSIKKRIALACLDGSITLIVFYFIFHTHFFSSEPLSSEVDFRIEHIDLMLGVSLFVLFMAVIILNVVRWFIFYGCERRLIKRPLSKTVYFIILSHAVLVAAIFWCSLELLPDLMFTALSLFLISIFLLCRLLIGVFKIYQSKKLVTT